MIEAGGYKLMLVVDANGPGHTIHMEGGRRKARVKRRINTTLRGKSFLIKAGGYKLMLVVDANEPLHTIHMAV